MVPTLHRGPGASAPLQRGLQPVHLQLLHAHGVEVLLAEVVQIPWLSRAQRCQRREVLLETRLLEERREIARLRRRMNFERNLRFPYGRTVGKE